MSNNCLLEELDDTIASVHDILASDQPTTKSPEILEWEQIIPNVEIILTEKESQQVTVTERQAQHVVHDSSSNTSLSQEEIIAMKKE